ncbi:MAG: bacillithiol system redox-active protein YtxJ [Polaribacter sp.]|nr:bacillithiol system redox-active protein YtxJ [Polaribacter sp.]
MSFIKKLFKSGTSLKEKELCIQWIPLVSMSQIEEIRKRSKSEVVLLFKHSTRCGISRNVLKQFESSFKEEEKSFKAYYLDLLTYRDVSDEVAATFQVVHQSPQIIFIKEGLVLTHASHYEIIQIDAKALLDK